MFGSPISLKMPPVHWMPLLCNLTCWCPIIQPHVVYSGPWLNQPMPNEHQQHGQSPVMMSPLDFGTVQISLGVFQFNTKIPTQIYVWMQPILIHILGLPNVLKELCNESSFFVTSVLRFNYPAVSFPWKCKEMSQFPASQVSHRQSWSSSVTKQITSTPSCFAWKCRSLLNGKARDAPTRAGSVLQRCDGKWPR